MAASCSFQSEDNLFLCTICLDVFTEPVSIPCGHNFCKACINRHWGDKLVYQCPLCKEKFNKVPKLCVNTGFREVVENFKKQRAIADNNSPVKPGQVPCDCCIGIKLKASKTCLLCLASYCETHLEPHLRVAALKRHKLTDPVHNLEDQICKKHNRMLELFCRTDQTCVCVLCTEHSAHETVPLEEAYVEKRAQVGKKKAAGQEMKRRHGKGTQQPKRNGKHQAMSIPVVSQAPLSWLLPHGEYLKFHLEVQAEKSSLGLGTPIRGTRVFRPEPRNKNWVIRLGTDTNCKAEVMTHCFMLTALPERVLAIVDYDHGSVSFIDADTMVPACSFSCCNFNKMIYCFYNSSPEDDSWAEWLQKKVQKMVKKVKAWSQPMDTEFYSIIPVLVFGFVLYFELY